MLNVSVKMSFSYPTDRQFYRVPHDVERVNASSRPDGSKEDFRMRTDGTKGLPRQIVINRGVALPEVYRLNPDHHVVLDCSYQWLWRNLNPNLTDKRWTTLLGNYLAWTNGTGFPGHYNCITGEEPKEPLPRYDQARVNGGAIVTGYEKDGLLYLETLKNFTAPPTLDDVKKSPWLWFWGTSVNKNGEANVITRTGADGTEYGVIVPLIAAMQATLPLNELHKLPLGESIPPPTWIP